MPNIPRLLPVFPFCIHELTARLVCCRLNQTSRLQFLRWHEGGVSKTEEGYINIAHDRSQHDRGSAMFNFICACGHLSQRLPDVCEFMQSRNLCGGPVGCWHSFINLLSVNFLYKRYWTYLYCVCHKICLIVVLLELHKNECGKSFMNSRSISFRMKWGDMHICRF